MRMNNTIVLNSLRVVGVMVGDGVIGDKRMGGHSSW